MAWLSASNHIRRAIDSFDSATVRAVVGADHATSTPSNRPGRPTVPAAGAAVSTGAVSTGAVSAGPVASVTVASVPAGAAPAAATAFWISARVTRPPVTVLMVSMWL